jgi:hypothetical protein
VNHLAALARGRARTEARMTETIRAGVFRDGTDPDTGDATRELVEEHYTGKAEVKSESLNVSTSDGAAQVVASQDRVIKVPIDAPILPEGDEVEVVTSLSDTSLQGRTYRITGAPQGGQTTSHRYPAEELS